MRTNGNTDQMQRIVNARLFQCVKDTGGITKFEQLTGVSRGTINGIKENRAMPSGLTIGMIQRAIPELDLNVLYAEGEGLEWKRDLIAIPSSVINEPVGLVSQLMALIADLRSQVTTQQEMIRQLQEEVKDYAQGFKKLAMKDLSFNLSGSHTTANVFSRIGFDYNSTSIEDAKVIAHPATLALNASQGKEVYVRWGVSATEPLKTA